MKGENKRTELPSNLKIYDVEPSLRYSGGLPISTSQSLLYILNSIRCGLRIMKKENVDIIHANTYIPVFIGVMLSKLTKRPLFVTIHDVALTNGLSFWRRWMNQFKASLFHSVVGYLIELLTIKAPANVIVTVSETSRDDILLVRKNSSVFVVPNGLDITAYDLAESEISYNDELVFIGRAVYYKNLDVVLSAMKTLVQKKPNVKLIVIGTGPVRSSWEHLAKQYGVEDNVIFKGQVSHEDKLRILKRATALVLPSTWEGFGMVLLEAWSLRKPVVVSKVRPLTDIVTHGKNGFHAHPFKAGEWAKFLEVLLQDKDLARRMGEFGYDTLVKNFTVQQTVQKLETLYVKFNT